LSGGTSAGSGPLPAGVGASGQSHQRAGADERLGQALFALLVLACFAAFLITQRLKHTPTAVQEFKLTNVIVPGSSGESKEERIAFKLAEADRVTVTIVSSGDQRVATLVRDLSAPRYKIVSLRWDGREGTARGYTVLRRADGYTTLLPINRGRLAPAGEYHVRVSLSEQDHSVDSPRGFTVVGP
jgi:hypothetical protein